MSTTSPSKETQVLPFPDEWLDYFYHQQFNDIDELDVPFAGDAVSEDNGLEDRATIPGSNGFFDAPGFETAASLKVSCCDETVFVVLDNTGTGTASNTAENSAAASSATVISLENSTAAGNDNNDVDLSPKAGIVKQAKRRSRASRRTPTTLLNSSIKNFRSIVQQCTGCQSSISGFNRDRKGPINLNFGAPR